MDSRGRSWMRRSLRAQNDSPDDSSRQCRPLETGLSVRIAASRSTFLACRTAAIHPPSLR